MPCPICNKPSDKEAKPFCSKHCANVDLGKWFNGDYAIPAEDPLEEEEIDQLIELADIPMQ